MDSVNGITPVIMSIMDAKAGGIRESVDMASMKMALDAQKTAGQQIVKMLENLGNTIDLYA